jgi:hypothetical protein
MDDSSFDEGGESVAKMTVIVRFVVPFQRQPSSKKAAQISGGHQSAVFQDFGSEPAAGSPGNSVRTEREASTSTTVLRH